MKLSVTKIFKKNVIGSRGKKVGLLSNLIIDTENLEARLLLFPEIMAGSWILDIIDTVDYVSGDFIQPISSTILADSGGVISRVADEVGRRAGNSIISREDKANQIYFLAPVSEIASVNNKRIVFDLESEEYKEFINMPISDADVAFYDDSAYNDPKRYYGISLNLLTLRGVQIRDPGDRKARITDIEFDVVEGLATSIIVRSPGKGIKKRMIDVRDIDFPSLSCNNLFESYPPT